MREIVTGQTVISRPHKNDRPRVERFLVLLSVIFFLSRAAFASGEGSAEEQKARALKNLSLEQLSNIEITTTNKAPANAFRTPAAVFVITGEDIKRSGATS